jgi:hypothetical protein
VKDKKINTEPNIKEEEVKEKKMNTEPNTKGEEEEVKDKKMNTEPNTNTDTNTDTDTIKKMLRRCIYIRALPELLCGRNVPSFQLPSSSSSRQYL